MKFEEEKPKLRQELRDLIIRGFQMKHHLANFEVKILLREIPELAEQIQEKELNIGALVLAPMVQARIIATLTEAENKATDPLIKKGFNDAVTQYLHLRNAQVKKIVSYAS